MQHRKARFSGNWRSVDPLNCSRLFRKLENPQEACDDHGPESEFGVGDARSRAIDGKCCKEAAHEREDDPKVFRCGQAAQPVREGAARVSHPRRSAGPLLAQGGGSVGTRFGLEAGHHFGMAQAGIQPAGGGTGGHRLDPPNPGTPHRTLEARPRRAAGSDLPPSASPRGCDRFRLRVDERAGGDHWGTPVRSSAVPRGLYLFELGVRSPLLFGVVRSPVGGASRRLASSRRRAPPSPQRQPLSRGQQPLL